MTKEQAYELLVDELFELNLFECANLDDNVKNYELGLIDGMAIIARSIVKKLEETK